MKSFGIMFFPYPTYLMQIDGIVDIKVDHKGV